MPSVKAKLLGRVLLEKKVISPAQLQECLEEQTRLRQSGVTPPQLGELLVSRGYLAATQLEEALRKRPPSVKPDAKRTSLPPEKIAASEELAQFRILGSLGSDAFGFSYDARHLATGARVILRMQAESMGELTPEEARYFFRHAEHAKKLGGKNLQRVLTVGRIEGQAYYAAEYFPGTSLHRLIAEEERLPWPWVVQIALQLLVALKYLEKMKFVHGAIRPSNILITAEGVVKLCGYGIMRNPLANSEKLLEEVPNVPFYISPEQALNERPADFRSDIYSLGATLYHAMVGRPPHVGNSLAEVIVSISREKPVEASSLVAHLHPFLSAIISRMLEVEEDARYQNAEELEKDFHSFLRRVNADERLAADYEKSVREYQEKFVEDSQLPGDRPQPAVTQAPAGFGLALAFRRNLAPFAVLLVMALALSWYYHHTQRHRAYMNKASLLAEKGDLAGAITALKKGLKVKPGDDGLLRRLVTVGEWSGDFASAEVAATSLAEKSGNRDPALLEQLGDLRAWQKEFPAALNAYRQSEQLTYKPGVVLKVAQTLREVGNYREAAATFRALFDRDRAQVPALLEAARTAFVGNDYIDAQRHYVAYLQERPDDPAAQIEYGDALAASGEFEQASAVLASYAASAKSMEADTAAAKAWLWAKKYSQAEEAFRKLLSADPDNLELWKNLAYACLGQNKTDAASACYQRMLQLAPSSTSVRETLAALYQGARKFDDAIGIYQELSRRFPGRARYALGIARSYAWAGKPAEAIEYYRKALELGGGREARIELAQTLIWAKQAEEAEKILSGLDDPGDIRILAGLAEIYVAQGKREKARELLNRAGTPQDAEELLKLVELEIKASDGKGRLERFRSWLEQHPEDWPTLKYFAQLLRAEGNHQEAWPLYKRLAEKFETDEALLLQASEEAAWSGYPDQELVLLEKLYRLQHGRKEAAADK
jgi:serine/threonine-protein kinase